MKLRDLILTRIDDAPHRPPTFSDLRRATMRSSVAISKELELMLCEHLIDTETGDSGLTYIKAKAPYVPELAPEKKPAVSIYPATPAAKAIGVWPKKATAIQSLPANCAAKQAAQVEATKAKFRKVLAKPLTINDYAKAANSSIYAARNLVARYVQLGFLARSGKRPNLIRVAQ